ncbi:DUF262 domain-containing protein [Spirosoma sp. RP8]|uniref:DUF262 domain-containing protein n=1 Tax=Spirosoma liriopis TaxID=2937440 RepID=A0ABT0HIQ6_9BACT|nr:DUF262 domain-containing protein [Spirosoma liriopis]MCK8491767.1 DUF262 domain-containing protein [Spirosoma liriopis]
MQRQPTIHQISWFLDLRNNGQLDLDPPYQRKSVWSLRDRKFFLDTIFRNYPTPPIFLHREIDDNGKTTYHVVDGKQRLETIFMFADAKVAIDAKFGDDNLNNKKFKDLSTEFKRKLWDYILVVDYVESVDGTSINDIFDRVNRTSKNLEPQELRHARFDGWFINLVETESSNKFWWDFKITTRGREKRMKNVQFISELFFIIADNKIAGFDHNYLDRKYAELDDPDEENPDFDQDEFLGKVEWVKTTITEMNNYNNCVFDCAKTQSNFYSLWALTALNYDRIVQIGINDYADRYKAFMDQVLTLLTDKDTVKNDGSDTPPQIKYATHLGGAVTDAMPRQERQNAISTILQ